MRQKFSIAKFVLATVAAVARSRRRYRRAPPTSRSRAPSPTATRCRRATRCGASPGRFLKDPWRWPDIWRMNREQIKNPHLIYPGDVDRPRPGRTGSGGFRSSVRRRGCRRPCASRRSTPKRSPRSRPATSNRICRGRSSPDPRDSTKSAEIVAGRDARVIRGEGDMIYVVGIDPKAGDLWNIYRQGRRLTSIDGKEVLGIEQRFLGRGEGRALRRRSPTLRITAANEGDPRRRPADSGAARPAHELRAARARPAASTARIIATDRDSHRSGARLDRDDRQGRARRARHRHGARDLPRRPADCGPATVHRGRSGRSGAEYATFFQPDRCSTCPTSAADCCSCSASSIASPTRSC